MKKLRIENLKKKKNLSLEINLNKMQKATRRILTITSLVFLLLANSYAQLPEISEVQNDLIKHNDSIMIEKDQILNMNYSAFSFIPIQNYCFVHVSNTSWIYDASLKSSAVVIYIKSNNDWKLLNIFPFYSNLKLFDENNLLFLSDNLLCENGVSCSSLISIFRFTGNSLVELVSYTGYSEISYLENSFYSNDLETVNKYLNKTVAKGVQIKNIQFDGKLKYKLVTEKIILSGYSDTLNLQTVISEESIIK